MGNGHAALGINKHHIVAVLSSPPTPASLFISSYPLALAITMLFMRTILALSLAAFSLAVPVAQPQGRLLKGVDLSAFRFIQYAFFARPINLT